MSYCSKRPAPSVHRPLRDPLLPAGPREADPAGTVDVTLLRGYRFSCLPNCGLCCYATPQVQPDERSRLVQLDPGLVLEESDNGWAGIALQGEGGACALLENTRCRFHEDRPSPCRLFPIHVHAGLQPQATLVLTCPGVELPLRALAGVVRSARAPDDGLGSERRWLDQITRAPNFRELVEQARADHEELRIRTRGRSHPVDETERRLRWYDRPPALQAEDFPATPGPGEEDGLESLPLFHDPQHGIVALAESEGRVDLLALDPRGGITERLGSYARIERRPGLTPAAAELFQAYLRLLALRDTFADSVRYFWWEERGNFGYFDLFEEQLRGAGATVLTRAVLRAMLEGRPGGVLDVDEVTAGIRATDAEILDLPVVGRNL